MSAAVFDLAGVPHAISYPPAGPAPRFAAEQLAYYLAVITGQRFAITPHGAASTELSEDIRLELITGSDLAPGAYRIAVTPKAVTLCGSDDLALLHAVYHFLESCCGCRWLATFEGGEVVPRDTVLRVPACDETHAPVFSHRGFTNYPDIDARTVDMLDWMCKNRFNRFMVFANVPGAFDRYREVLREHVLLRGMRVEMGHHSFSYWLPPQAHFADHPQWYAQVNGQRVSDGQLCTSNPQVVDAVALGISAFLADNPEVDLVGLWPNDGYGWCECEACLLLEPQRPSELFADHPVRTATYLRFVKQVAERVAQEHPDRRLSALAYVNYVEPPQDDLPANVAVCFAPMHRCFKHPLDAPGECTQQNRRYMELLAQWRPRVPGTLYLFCYLMLIDMCSVPYRITHMLGPEFRTLAQLGVDGYVMEYKPEEWGPYGVNAHLMGRLSWEPGPDVEAWLSDYYRHLYGPAAADMRDCWNAFLDDFIAPGPCVYHYDLTYTRRATHELLRHTLEHLGRARAAATTGERRHVEAVERAHVGIELLLRLGEWQRAVGRARRAAGPNRRLLAEHALQLGDALMTWAETHKDSGAIFLPRIALIVRLARAELSP